MRLFAILTFLVCLIPAMVAGGPLLCVPDARGFSMSNGRLSARIERATGAVSSVTFDGRELLGSGTGYWSMSANSGRSRVGGFGRSVTQEVSMDPSVDGADRAEVTLHFRGTGTDGSFPGRVEVRYSMGKDSDVLHVCAILRHGRGDAPFRMGEARFVLKLDPGIFNHLTVDSKRDRVMPTGADWEHGETLNMKEVRRMKSGIHAGEVEHKYAYSAMLGETPAYGWSGAGFGVWMINPSVEYIAGGPTKMELTAHLDVGGNADPTLLNMWHGSHYGGTMMMLEQDENWSRVIGPFAVHFNSGGDAESLYSRAVARAAEEKKAWPYVWMKDDAYPSASERGALSGKIEVSEKGQTGRFWVGLTSPDYFVGGVRRPPESIGWQRDGKNYQYWVKADADGTFRIPAVRPGRYEMHAFCDGILGEYVQRDLEIAAGAYRGVGVVAWNPERSGPTLWQIGVADRSAAEFKNGGRFWEWGNYYQYRKDFPNGVDYRIGVSDWAKDWHICQPLNLAENGAVLGSSTWKIRFPLGEVPGGGARLRLSICGSREGSRLVVILNGKAMGKPLAMPENGVMHRDSHRGLWFERIVPIAAEDLVVGENVLQLRLEGQVWHQGILYDCVRLEAVSPPLRASVPGS